MFDMPENATTPVGTAPVAAAEQAPAPVPAPTAADTATPAAFDVQAFEQSLKQFGPDWTPDNYREKLAETRTSLATQGRELTEYKRKYRELDEKATPFLNTMQSDQAFANGIQQFVTQYYSGQAQEPTMQGYTPQYAAPLAGFDPVLQRVNQLEQGWRSSQATQELNDLVNKGYPLNEEMAAQVMDRYNDPQYGKLSARDHYMVLFSDKVLKEREQAAAKAAVEAIQKNNDSYTPGPAHSAPAPPPGRPDMTGWTQEQFNAYAVKRNEEILGRMRGA